MYGIQNDIWYIDTDKGYCLQTKHLFDSQYELHFYLSKRYNILRHILFKKHNW